MLSRKKLIFLIISLLFLIILTSCLNNPEPIFNQDINNQNSNISKISKIFSFSGRSWIPSNEKNANPGPNDFSYNNIILDNNNCLHLQINKDKNGRWTCAGIESVERLSYGLYTFQFTGNILNILKPLNYNPFVVAGLFYYLDDSNEIDIEFTHSFKNIIFINSYYSVKPLPSEENINMFSFNTSIGDGTTHQFLFTPKKIYFRSMNGYVNDTNIFSANPAFSNWDYESCEQYGKIPEIGGKLCLNLWLSNNTFSSSFPLFNSAEIIIKKAEYIPAQQLDYLSNNTLLSNLILKANNETICDIDFNPTTYNYGINVPNEITSIMVEPTTDDPQALAKVQNKPWLECTYPYAYSIPLKVGDNVIRVEVIAQNGQTNSYNINVNRESASQYKEITFTKMNWWGPPECPNPDFQDDPNNLLPWPTERVSTSSGNTATSSLVAGPGNAGVAISKVGLKFNWDLKKYIWDEVKDLRVDVTIDFSYTIEAYWNDDYGSANAFITMFPFIGNIDGIGYELSNTGKIEKPKTETIQTTVEELGNIIYLDAYCQTHLISEGSYGDHKSLARVTINSIKLRYPGIIKPKLM